MEHEALLGGGNGPHQTKYKSAWSNFLQTISNITLETEHVDQYNSIVNTHAAFGKNPTYRERLAFYLDASNVGRR